MLAYIGGLVPLAVEDTSSDSTLFIYFCGSDFKQAHMPNSDCQEFKEEFISDLRDLRPELDVFIEQGKHIVLGGGEPLLQRAPLIYLCSYIHQAGGLVEIETNGTKPNILRELLVKRIVDRVTFLLPAPLDAERFQKVTNSGTFFKPTSEVIADVKESIELLRQHHDDYDITVRTTVVPSLLFKKEDLLKIASHIKGLNCRWELVPFTNEGVKSRKFSGITAPSEEFLMRIKETCSREYPQLRIDVEEARILPTSGLFGGTDMSGSSELS